jgi:hypothetical protein
MLELWFRRFVDGARQDGARAGRAGATAPPFKAGVAAA